MIKIKEQNQVNKKLARCSRNSLILTANKTTTDFSALIIFNISELVNCKSKRTK